MKMWYVPSLWETPVKVTVIDTEKRPDGRPIYIRSVDGAGHAIDDYANKFSRTKPVLFGRG